MLFPTVGWPTTSALAANLAYLYTLLLCTFFSSLYHNVVIQSTLLQYCDKRGYPKFLKLEYLKYRPGAKKATIRLKVSTLRAK